MVVLFYTELRYYTELHVLVEHFHFDDPEDLTAIPFLVENIEGLADILHEDPVNLITLLDAVGAHVGTDESIKPAQLFCLKSPHTEPPCF